MAASLDFRVDFDAGLFARYLDDVVAREIPFATAVALSRTVRDMRDVTQADLDRYFTIRGPRVRRGIQMRGATKRTLTAQIGSRDAFMALHETGGFKEPTGSNKTVAVPVRARLRPTSKTPPSKWPGALLRKPRHFLGTLKTGQPVIYRRSGKGKRAKFVIMYYLPNKVRIDEHWPFFDTVADVMVDVWHRHAIEALEEAVASGKARELRRQARRRRR